jgi:DNA topoisomerase-1
MGRTQARTGQPGGVHLAAPAAATAAGLRYVGAGAPGLRRRKAGKGFVYLRPDGERLRDARELERIRGLVIPPAWSDVWICASPEGHIQAVGRDARGRKQYRYHPRWRTSRDEAKYGRMVAFGKTLPRIRARAEEDLARPGLPREKVLALVARLLERTLIRVGNEEYARANRSFGLTTLRSHHVDVAGRKIRFQFRGKSGKEHEVGIQDLGLSRIVRRCQELPGQELFQFVDEDGEVRDVTSDDVNDYIREASGGDFTAKDFRTWAGTVLAYRALRALQPGVGEGAAKRNVVEAIRQTADRLGNTPAVARGSYVHPAVLEAYLAGSIPGALVEAAEEQATPPTSATPREEAAVRALLRQRLEDDAARAGRGRATSRRSGRANESGQAADS